LDTKPIKQLLEKDMNRKEFLLHLGAGALTIVGISGLLKTLNGFSTKPKVSSGYGSSPYGGKSLKANK
jgi:hypothetical protein